MMTCASHVQKNGKGFPGQLGIFSDKHIPGHQRLVKVIQSHGSLAVIQLHHAGMRSPHELIDGAPLCPSENKKYGARSLMHDEVIQLRNDFIQAAIRSKKCGYDGVEIHGAHGYILCQFLSSEINNRTDEYGGNLENRARLIQEIAQGIREACGEHFLLGLRLSPERFGMDIQEIKTLCGWLIDSNVLDFLDISLWDCFKMPEDEKYKDKPLLDHFTSMDRKNTVLTVAGKIMTANDVQRIMDAGIDFVSIGRAAILHHDYPLRVINDSQFSPVPTPVSPTYLRNEGLSNIFINYMRRWPLFVKD